MKEMRRFAAVLFVFALLFGAVAHAAPAESAKQVNLSIGTSSLGGNFFTMGAAIATVVADHLNYRTTAQATGGSAFNVDAVHIKDLDSAISQATSIAAAFRGTDQFEGQPIRDVRTLINWNATPLHILAKRSIGAKNITDLGGSRFECMTPGDGIELSTKMILSLYDMAEKVTLDYSGNRVQSASRFKTGGIDVIMDGTGVGAAWMNDVIGDGSKLELLSLTEEQITKITASYPELSKMVIPANSYKGQPEDVVTVGNWTTMIVHESMDDEVAYNITRCIFENKETLVQAHNFFKDLEPSNIVDACVAPLHPGAEKYYKEIQILK